MAFEHTLASVRLGLLVSWQRCYEQKGKGKGTCHSAYYTSQTSGQKRFTISGQVAADCHELMIYPQSPAHYAAIHTARIRPAVCS